MTVHPRITRHAASRPVVGPVVSPSKTASEIPDPVAPEVETETEARAAGPVIGVPDLEATTSMAVYRVGAAPPKAGTLRAGELFVEFDHTGTRLPVLYCGVPAAIDPDGSIILADPNVISDPPADDPPSSE